MLHENVEGMNRLIEAIVGLGEVSVPSDIMGGLHLLGQALERVINNRQALSRIHARVLVNAKTWASEVRGREAEYKIKLDDLVNNDPHVKGGPNNEARMARARSLCIFDYRKVVEAQKEKGVWDALLEICDQTRENLKIAKESVSRLCSIAEMQVTDAGFNFGTPR